MRKADWVCSYLSKDNDKEEEGCLLTPTSPSGSFPLAIYCQRRLVGEGMGLNPHPDHP